jgi:hypothetical protein
MPLHRMVKKDIEITICLFPGVLGQSFPIFYSSGFETGLILGSVQSKRSIENVLQTRTAANRGGWVVHAKLSPKCPKFRRYLDGGKFILG